MKRPSDLIIVALLTGLLAAIGWCASEFVRTIHRMDENEAAYNAYNTAFVRKKLRQLLFIDAYVDVWNRARQRDERLVKCARDAAAAGHSLSMSLRPLLKEFAAEALDDQAKIEAFRGEEFQLVADMRESVTNYVHQQRAVWTRLNDLLAQQEDGGRPYDEKTAKTEMHAMLEDYFQLGTIVDTRKGAWREVMDEENREFFWAAERHAQQIAANKTERWLFGIFGACLMGALAIFVGVLFCESRHKAKPA